jgi:starch-binding outer membrane protein, SusD/RagB family
MLTLMNKRSLALLAGLALAVPACKDSTSVGDLNNVSADALAAGLTRSSTGLLAIGLVNASRTELDSRYLVFTETMGRDLYRLDNAENRYITELIGPQPADYSAFTGGGAFTNMYVTVRSANTLLAGLTNASGITAQEKSATSGFAKTFKALSLYRVLETRDSLGIAVDVDKPIDAAPAEFVCKPNALAFISTLLDEGATELTAAGSADFPFTLPGGFSIDGDFTTPAAILQFNRGLKGKVELYRGLSRQKPNTGSFATALTALNASFISPTGSMDKGIYNTYSTASGDATNPLGDANVYLNPAVGSGIQAGDARAAKIITIATKTLAGVTTTYKSPLTDPAAANLGRAIPVLKNAELLLLRAQVYIELNNFALAAADINAVRTADGELTPIAVPLTKAAAIDAVLYEKRYSLLTESAHRLVDLRAYSRLNAAAGPGAAGDLFQTTLPIPKRELDARGVVAPATITPACP